jgi:hypothetical protein
VPEAYEGVNSSMVEEVLPRGIITSPKLPLCVCLAGYAFTCSNVVSLQLVKARAAVAALRQHNADLQKALDARCTAGQRERKCEGRRTMAIAPTRGNACLFTSAYSHLAYSRVHYFTFSEPWEGEPIERHTAS